VIWAALLLGVLVVAALALWGVGVWRATRAALRSGAPTGEEARIDAKAADATTAAKTEAERERQEVLDASTEELAQRKRDALARGVLK